MKPIVPFLNKLFLDGKIFASGTEHLPTRHTLIENCRSVKKLQRYFSLHELVSKEEGRPWASFMRKVTGSNLGIYPILISTVYLWLYYSLYYNSCPHRAVVLGDGEIKKKEVATFEKRLHPELGEAWHPWRDGAPGKWGATKLELLPRSLF